MSKTIITVLSSKLRLSPRKPYYFWRVNLCLFVMFFCGYTIGQYDTSTGEDTTTSTSDLPSLSIPTAPTIPSAPTVSTSVITPEAVYINSQVMTNARTDLLPGTAYVPADAFAEAVGTEVLQTEDGRELKLEYGPMLVSLDIFNDADQAAIATNALGIEGVNRAIPSFSPGAIEVDNEIFVPVESLSKVLGADVNINEVGTVPSLLVVFPRAELLNIRFFPAGRSGSASGTESFVLEFSDIVPVKTTRNIALGVVTYRFARTDNNSNPSTYSGDLLRRGQINSDRGWTDLRLELTRGNDSRLLNEMRDGKYIVSIDIANEDQFDTDSNTASVGTTPNIDAVLAPNVDRNDRAVNSSTVSTSNPLAPQNTSIVSPSESLGTPMVTGLPNRPQILLDPAHGGIDQGKNLNGLSEAVQVYDLAQKLQESLSTHGLRVGLTRAGDTQLSLKERSNMAVGVPLFISLHAADLPSRSFNIYYLGEASRDSSLDLALQQNAETELRSSNTDAIRRQILLSLVPDLSNGERYARQFANYLAEQGLRFQTVDAAPIYVLSGAAGRGVLLELSQSDLRDAQGINYLNEALSQSIIEITQEPQ